MMPIIKPNNTLIWSPCQESNGMPINKISGGSNLTSIGVFSSVTGKLGKATYVNPSNTAEGGGYTVTSFYRGSGAASCCAWVYPIYFSWGDMFSILSSCNGTQNSFEFWGYFSNTSTMNIRISCYFSGTSAFFQVSGIPTGKWHFFGFSLSGNGTNPACALYIDGAYSSGTINGTISTEYNNAVLFAGNSYGQRFRGYISHIQVLNVALTQKEFAAIYQSTKGAYLL